MQCILKVVLLSIALQALAIDGFQSLHHMQKRLQYSAPTKQCFHSFSTRSTMHYSSSSSDIGTDSSDISPDISSGSSKAFKAFKALSQVEDDGFSRSHSRMWLRRLWNRITGTEPGCLILVRHGETAMNYNKTFTGWIDTDLSETGMKEMNHAANLLLERGFKVDVTYSSRLKRAIRSSWVLLIGMNQVFKPVYKSWRLNERMYGDLEGLSKVAVATQMGETLVQGWRRGLLERPPAMLPTHPHWHHDEPKYADLDAAEKPLTESLQDTMQRTIPLWQSRVLPLLKSGKNVMIVAHANSLRGIVKHIDNVSPEDIPNVHIPNAIPLVYRFDRSMRPVKHPDAAAPLSGEFLEKSGLLKLALEKERQLSVRVPGLGEGELQQQSNSTALDAERFDDLYNMLISPDYSSKDRDLAAAVAAVAAVYHNDSKQDAHWAKIDRSTQFDAVLDGLARLNRTRDLMGPEGRAIYDLLAAADADNDDDAYSSGSRAERMSRAAAIVSQQMNQTDGSVSMKRLLDRQQRQQQHKQAASASEVQKPQYVIITRHGKTRYNQLGIFTGWEDAPLADSGRQEARAAGALLRRHGIQFEVVYTSWLSRAIETAWLILDELDLLWLPIVKSWRLNERMYGALTGMSKRMIAERHGKEQFKKWRRGYKTRPPPTSSFSSVYPGNDERYSENEVDIRYSFTESLIRSLAHRRPELHRKFPKTESLHDCMRRTIPYYQKVIKPDSVDKGKNVLISSSENAIRGLLMYLCEIPPDRIHEVEIPTGLPLVYNMEKRCIQLLDDGKQREGGAAAMLDEYNFGSSPELLFRPCTAEEANGEQDSCLLYYTKDGVSLLYDPIIRLPDTAAVDAATSKSTEAVTTDTVAAVVDAAGVNAITDIEVRPVTAATAEA